MCAEINWIDEQSSVPESAQILFGEIMQNNPGITIADLDIFYQTQRGFNMRPADWNLSSVADVVTSLTNIFRKVTSSNGVTRLFAAFLPVGEEEKKLLADPFERTPEIVKSNIRSLLIYHPQRVYINGLEQLYQEKYDLPIDYQSYGYETLRDFLNAHDGKVFYLNVDDTGIYFAPIIEPEESVCTSGIDVFNMSRDNFPSDVISPHEHLYNISTSVLKTDEEFGIRITAYDKNDYLNGFFFILEEYVQIYVDLCIQITNFYDKNEEKYRMPEWVCQKQVYCVVRYKKFGWFRAQIINAYLNSIHCICLDYGYYTKVKPNEICYMHVDFATLSCQSFKGKLAFCKPIKKNYTKIAHGNFAMLINFDHLTAALRRIEGDITDPVAHITVYANGVNVLHALVEKGLVITEEETSMVVCDFPNASDDDRITKNDNNVDITPETETNDAYIVDKTSVAIVSEDLNLEKKVEIVAKSEMFARPESLLTDDSDGSTAFSSESMPEEEKAAQLRNNDHHLMSVNNTIYEESLKNRRWVAKGEEYFAKMEVVKLDNESYYKPPPGFPPLTMLSPPPSVQNGLRPPLDNSPAQKLETISSEKLDTAFSAECAISESSDDDDEIDSSTRAYDIDFYGLANFDHDDNVQVEITEVQFGNLVFNKIGILGHSFLAIDEIHEKIPAVPLRKHFPAQAAQLYEELSYQKERFPKLCETICSKVPSCNADDGIYLIPFGDLLRLLKAVSSIPDAIVPVISKLMDEHYFLLGNF